MSEDLGSIFSGIDFSSVVFGLSTMGLSISVGGDAVNAADARFMSLVPAAAIVAPMSVCARARIM